MKKNLIKKIALSCMAACIGLSMIGQKSFADSNTINKESKELVFEDRIDSSYAKKVSDVKYMYGKNRYETAVSVSRAGWKHGSNVVVLVNSSNPIYGIIATPLATTFEAPILITNNNNMNSDVLEEFKRLKPEKVIILGDRELVSKNIANVIKTATGTKIERIFGKTPSELSYSVANYMNTMVKSSKAYIVSITNGVADALTISSKAGEEKSPILVIDSKDISSKNINYIRDYIHDVYYIGGAKSIPNSVVSKVSKIAKNATEKNRIFGNDRHATNVNVINKFYPDKDLDAVVITKSDNNGLIDTVCAGPYSAQKNAPIIITDRTHIPAVTKLLLEQRKADKLYQIGGGINQSVTNQIVAELGVIKAPIQNTDKDKDDDKEKDKSKDDKDKDKIKDDKDTDKKDNINNPNSDKKDDEEERELIPQSLKGGIKGKKIVVDAGHGGKDNGSTGVFGVREKDLTLKTAIACADELRKAGAVVIMTRALDTYPTLKDRTDLSNASEAAFFCSIHYNQGGSPINVAEREYSGTGAEVFRDGDDFSKLAAQNVLNNILSNFNLKNRGVKNGTALYVIRNSQAPSILVEGGFVSSKHDMGLINNDKALDKMGREIAKGIIAAFEAYK